MKSKILIIALKAGFVQTKAELFKPHERPTQFGTIPNIDRNLLLKFFEDVYSDTENIFKSINIKLVDYYLALLDGLVIVAKMLINTMSLKNRKRNLHWPTYTE